MNKVVTFMLTEIRKLVTVAVSVLKNHTYTVNVKNFPKQSTGVQDFPKDIRVSNLKDIPAVNFSELRLVLATLKRSIDNMKSDTAIPDMEKLRGTDAKKYVPVRLSDGDKFYDALISVSGGLRRPTEIQNIDPLEVYQVADKDTAGATKYYGFTDQDENWYILKEDTTTETYRYVKAAGGYAVAWGNRASLIYKYFHESF